MLALQNYFFSTIEWCINDEIYQMINDPKCNTHSAAYGHSSMIADDHDGAVSQIERLQAHVFFGI